MKEKKIITFINKHTHTMPGSEIQLKWQMSIVIKTFITFCKMYAEVNHKMNQKIECIKSINL